MAKFRLATSAKLLLPLLILCLPSLASADLPSPQLTFLSPSGPLYGTLVLQPTTMYAPRGSTLSTEVDIRNDGNDPFPIYGLTITGPNAVDFHINANNYSGCTSQPTASGDVIPPNSTCSVMVYFAPIAPGLRTATLVVSSNSFLPATLTLSGIGVSPGGLTFSSYGLYSNVRSANDLGIPQTFTITNNQITPINFSAPLTPVVSSPPGAVVTLSGSCPLVYTLEPGASCSVTASATASGTPTSAAVGAISGSIDVPGQSPLEVSIPIVLSFNVGLLFIPTVPCRVADTRNPSGDLGGPKIAANTFRSFPVTASDCNIPSNAAAYSMNVTVVPDHQLSYLTVWPAGQSMPLASTLNSDGRVKANAAIVSSGVSGGVSVFATDSTHVILDINGYFVPHNIYNEEIGLADNGLVFYPITPCRIADTRNADSPLGGPSIADNGTRTFPVLNSQCAIPPTALAYSLNLTAVAANPISYLTAWPAGQDAPLASTLNSSAPGVTANAAIIPAGTNGDISILSTNATDIVIDINGYFGPSSDGIDVEVPQFLFYPTEPCRVLDTRSSGSGQPFTGTLNVNVAASSCKVPLSAQAYVLNATVVPAGKDLSYLSLWPQGQSQPYVSTLNSNGGVVSNMAIVPANSGAISAFATDPAQLILDLSGFFGLFPY